MAKSNPPTANSQIIIQGSSQGNSRDSSRDSSRGNFQGKTFTTDQTPLWITSGALCFALLGLLGLLYIILVNGLSLFGVKALVQIKTADQIFLGHITQTTEDKIQLKIGNQDLYNLDFHWLNKSEIQQTQTPPTALTVERSEYGHFYGFSSQPEQLEEWLAQKAIANEWQTKIDAVRQQLYDQPDLDDQTIDSLLNQQDEWVKQRDNYKLELTSVDGQTLVWPVSKIVRLYQPNQLGFFSKIGLYFSKLWELLTAEPREANTEGGIYPAIFGTVILVFLMSLFSFPLGIVTAVYLHEYAKGGFLVKAIRIAVNNLAGVPSIVFGVFGLGFFVYGLGASIDRWFFAEQLPTPTFGTGGILWASLTLGLLTIPVVTVATEEALSSVPGGIRQASLALGATQLQTLLRFVLPMASPGILTGLILSMARAAGEVAPLMITGVVKFSSDLPLDSEFPFIHLERKFMHLGFHIFDLGFQSPNSEAALPALFATTLVLIVIVLIMASVAIHLRNKMHAKYSNLDL